MLAFVVVLLVAVGVSDSVTLTECELKQQIQTHLVLPTSVPDLMAKIVCHVKLTSNFSTSAVRTINVTDSKMAHEGKKGHKRKVRAARKAVGMKGHPASVTPAHSSVESVEDTHQVWTLYGLFQLSDHVACNSTTSPTQNLCNLTCDKLIDNDITDDLACVKVLMTKITANEMDDLHKMMALLKQKECVNVKDSQYFANCPV